MDSKYLEPTAPTWVRFGLRVMDIFGKVVKWIATLYCQSPRREQLTLEPKRILVIPYQHMGDTLIATPAIRALRQSFPKAYIVVLASPSGAAVLRGNPDIDEIRVFSSPWHKPLELLPHHEPNSLRKWIRLIAYYRTCLSIVFTEGKKLRTYGFDWGIEFHGTVYNTLLMVIARIPVRVGPNHVGIAHLLTHPVSLPDPRRINEIDRCLNIVRTIGAKVEGRKPFVTCTPEDEKAILKKLSDRGILSEDILVVAHPGCFSAPASRWRPEAWAKVLDTLIEELKVKVVLNGVQNEHPEIEAIKACMQQTAIDLCGQLTIPELIALLKRCNLLLTVNSGPMHIASALGTPTVVIQGAWNVTRFRPYGDNFVLIVKDVPCVDCGFRICPKPISCMDMIEPEEVIDAAIKKLQEIKAMKMCPS